LNSNIVLMKNMIAQGYNDKRALERRIKAVEAWLANPHLLEADANAEYAHVLDIDMDQLKEPVLCCPNDPDDAKLLSDVAGTKIDEVFIGSCMTNIGHFRAASKLLEGRRDIPVKLWIAPPTKMDATAYLALLAHAPKCQAAPCAWATKLKCVRVLRWSQLQHAISPTAWAKTPTCIWHPLRLQPSAPSWVAFQPQKSTNLA
jgi:hypothetical protein